VAASSDPPPDPDAGALVDPDVLERRRAAREDPSAQAEVERLRAQQQLAERRTGELEAEVTLLASELDRRIAEHAAVASQVARLRSALAALRERAGEEEAHQAATAVTLAQLRAGQERVGEALETLRAEHASTLAQLEGERRRREALEALLAEERVRFATELARTGAGARAERGALARRLHEAQRAVSTLEAEVEAAGAAFRRRLAAASTPSPGHSEVVEHLVADILGSVDALRGPSAYDAPTTTAGLPSADHPALARAPQPAAGAASPAVVGDLERAAARLRAARNAEAEPAPAPPAPVPATAVAPPAPLPAARAPLPLGVLHAAGPLPATTTPWLRDALVALDARDAAAAERILLTALALQPAKLSADVAYELELPVSGRHLVTAVAGGAVTVIPLADGEQPACDVRLHGSAAALAPLAAGGASRRLPGVRVRGRRRRLRRLLRALAAPVGLPELQAAGLHPAPADLLALLAAGVSPARVGETRLRVAYLVADATSVPERVVLQAGAGAVTVRDAEPAAAPVDATVTVEPRQLLGVLAGTEPALVAGDAAAAGTLHGWLRAGQAASA
jgi:hypothetical protein